MKSTLTVQLDTATLLKLINRLSELGGTQDLSEGVSSAIEFWLAEQAKLATGCDPASVRGYQWKSLFLPEGTVLRSWSYGDHNYARVEGDQIIHEGKSVSPNQFAQLFARTTRKTNLLSRHAIRHLAPGGLCPSAANSVSGWKTSRSTEKFLKKSGPLGMLKAFFKALKAPKSDLYRTQWLPRWGPRFHIA
ncbi:hypothetical protein NHH73_08590 [Oxalobacteraceae bacterium OTU3CINTB1]|nr:hypothetical protein NHH73_08590 [Oxalobacteraceae bacterium OTU3CINTB1]